MTKHKQILGLILLSLILNLSHAHQGYNPVLKKLELSPYQLSFFEDTHEDAGVQLSIFVQLSQNGQEAPEGTNLTLTLEQNGSILITKPLIDLGPATDDGKTIYRAYTLQQTLTNAGTFNATLSITNQETSTQHSFQLTAQPTQELPLSEFLPSLIIILIPTLSLATLALSSRKDKNHANQTSHPNQPQANPKTKPSYPAHP